MQGYDFFVLVLIDGSRNQFDENLVAQGCQGGYTAADCTRICIEENVKRSDFYIEDRTAIPITVFTNLHILATKSSLRSLVVRDFAHGFNDTHLLTKFQNIGQSAAQHKRLGGVLARVLQDDRCLQVIFVGSTWRGFEDFVRHQNSHGQRITRSKTTAIPVPHFLHPVTQRPQRLEIETSLGSTDISVTAHLRYHRLSVDSAILFDSPPPRTGDVMAREEERTENSTNFPMSAVITPYGIDTVDADPSTTSNVQQRSVTGHFQQMTSNDDPVRTIPPGGLGPTTVTARPRTMRIDTKDTSTSSNTNFRREDIEITSGVIPRNQIGQRVDPPIKFNRELKRKMSEEKWCSNHQLKGVCSHSGCEFKHDFLDQEGKNALLSLARGTPCRNGAGCNEADCYAGHHCPYSPCKKGQACTFSKQRPDMHIHDKQIVNLVALSRPQRRHHRTRVPESQARFNGNWR